jgi:hypothetical protein
MFVSKVEHICSCDGRVEEAQMLWWAARMLEMPSREHHMHILVAKADGTAEEATTGRG